MARATISRAAHDVGLAAWFGGTLANAVALNAAAGAVSDAKDAGRVANAGWNRWTPVNFVAIAAHVVGSVLQLNANKSRLTAQQGVATMSIVKTSITVAALGITYYSRVLGRKIADHGAVPMASGVDPAPGTPEEVVKASKQLKALQWIIPALTGALVVVTSFAGEQQRASEVSSGFFSRLLPTR
jgi:hypothetical protein